MKPSTPNRVIIALLVFFVALLAGGKLISDGWKLVGSLVVLLGVAIALFALLSSDESFEKFPWWLGWW